MDTSTDLLSQSDPELYPRRTTCRRCGVRFRYVILDRQYCSYQCAGVPIPDTAGDHPSTCWTWDDKPKMCFVTPRLAESAREGLGIPGTGSYYCALHHLWHVGYDLEDRHDGRMADMTSDDDVARHKALESYIPAQVGRAGTHINDVERIANHARNVYLHFDKSASTLQRWRDWYGLYVQMLADKIKTVPPGYSWDPVTMTC